MHTHMYLYAQQILSQRYKKKLTYPNNRIKIFDFCEFCDYLGE